MIFKTFKWQLRFLFLFFKISDDFFKPMCHNTALVQAKGPQSFTGAYFLPLNQWSFSEERMLTLHIVTLSSLIHRFWSRGTAKDVSKSHLICPRREGRYAFQSDQPTTGLFYWSFKVTFFCRVCILNWCISKNIYIYYKESAIRQILSNANTLVRTVMYIDRVYETLFVFSSLKWSIARS